MRCAFAAATVVLAWAAFTAVVVAFAALSAFCTLATFCTGFALLFAWRGVGVCGCVGGRTVAVVAAVVTVTTRGAITAFTTFVAWFVACALGVVFFAFATFTVAATAFAVATTTTVVFAVTVFFVAGSGLGFFFAAAKQAGEPTPEAACAGFSFGFVAFGGLFVCHGFGGVCRGRCIGQHAFDDGGLLVGGLL